MKSNVPTNLATSRAAHYLARAYSGEMSVAEEQQFDAWLKESQKNRREYQAVLDAWDESDELLFFPEFANVEQGVGQGFDEVGETATRRKFGWAVAASLILATCIGLLSYNQFTGEPKLIQHTTRTGEQRTLTLADGSVVTLNTNSRLLVDFSDQNRRVILDRGEAFFDVSKDASRPFTVEAGNRSVTVVGTRFNMNRAEGPLSVAVVEGAVVVHRKEDQILWNSQPNTIAENTRSGDQDQLLLTAGYVIDFGGDAVVKTVTESMLQNYYSWREGIVRFDEEPLLEVVKELNRYTTKKLLIEDREVMDIHVSGVFDVGQLDDVIDGLEEMFPLRITRYTDRVVIMGRRK